MHASQHGRTLSESQLLSLHHPFSTVATSSSSPLFPYDPHSSTPYSTHTDEMIESTTENIEQDLFPQLGLSDFEAEENEFELLAGRALSALFNANGMRSGEIGSSIGELEKNYVGTLSAGSSETGSPTLLYDGDDAQGSGVDSTTQEGQDPLFSPYSRIDSIPSSAHYFSEGDVVEDSPLYADGGFRGERYYSRRELGAGVRTKSDSSTGSSTDGGVIDYAVSPSTSPSKTPPLLSPPSIADSSTTTSKSTLATRRATRRSSSPPTTSLIPSRPSSAPRKTSINLELLRLGSPSAGIDGRGIDGLMTRSTRRRRNSSISPSRSTSTSLIKPTTTGGFELSVVGRNGGAGLASPLKGVLEGTGGSVSDEEERGRLECPLTPGLDRIFKKREGGFIF